MQNITVTRYADPQGTGWAGYLEPADKTWIAFIDLQGKPLFFLNRDPATGAILGADPTKHAEDLADLRAEKAGPNPGQHIGEPCDGSAVYPPGERSPHKVGEAIHPLGMTGAPLPD